MVSIALTLTLTQTAQDDLLEAWLYIAKEDQQAADGVLDVIDREARTLLLQPLMGRARPELAAGVRSWPTSTPYILFYVANTQGITVVRVLHHARDVRLAAFDELGQRKTDVPTQDGD